MKLELKAGPAALPVSCSVLFCFVQSRPTCPALGAANNRHNSALESLVICLGQTSKMASTEHDNGEAAPHTPSVLVHVEFRFVQDQARYHKHANSSLFSSVAVSRLFSTARNISSSVCHSGLLRTALLLRRGRRRQRDSLLLRHCFAQSIARSFLHLRIELSSSQRVRCLPSLKRDQLLRTSNSRRTCQRALRATAYCGM